MPREYNTQLSQLSLQNRRGSEFHARFSEQSLPTSGSSIQLALPKPADTLRLTLHLAAGAQCCCQVGTGEAG